MGAGLLLGAAGWSLAAFAGWLYIRAQKKVSVLKAELTQLRKDVFNARELSSSRIRDLTGLDPDRVRIDEDGGIWAE